MVAAVLHVRELDDDDDDADEGGGGGGESPADRSNSGSRPTSTGSARTNSGGRPTPAASTRTVEASRPGDWPTSAPGLARICAGTGPHRRRDWPTSAPGLHSTGAPWPSRPYRRCAPGLADGRRARREHARAYRSCSGGNPPARPAPPQSECSDHLARSARRAARRGRATGQRRRRLCVCLRSCNLVVGQRTYTAA